MTDLVSFTQNVPKLKTFKTCVLNFRSICVDLSKSDKISTYILGLLVTKYVGLIKNNLYSSHISDMLCLSLGGGVFTNYKYVDLTKNNLYHALFDASLLFLS